MFEINDRVTVDNMNASLTGPAHWIGRIGKVINTTLGGDLPIAVEFPAPPPCGIVNFAASELRQTIFKWPDAA